MTKAPSIAEKLKRVRVDALYGKRKHFNAADRKRRHHLCLGIPVLAIGILSGSTLFALLGDTVPEFAKWVGALLALLSALLAGLQTFFNFRKAIEGHCTIATRYLDLAKRIELLLAAHSDGVIDTSRLYEAAEVIVSEYADITRDASVFSTRRKDYELARKGFEEGEEAYTEKELGED
jgi:hypothetical protein